MDRESTPVKQRQKRGANRKSGGNGSASTSGGNGSSARAFRPSNSTNQRSRSRTTAGSGATASNASAPAAILAKPSVLRASEAGNAVGANAAALPAPTGTLWEPSDSRRASSSSTTGGAAFRASTGGLQRSGSGLMVNTRLSVPGGASAAAAPPPADRRSPAMTRKASMPPPPPSPLVQQQQQYRHAPPKLPPTRVKLVTPALQFATDLAPKLSGCLEVSNLTVVGVLGLDGVGKSTVASLLSRKERDGGGDDVMFPSQSLETVALGCSETAGVDMTVVPNGPGLVSSNHHRHLVLLDAQPMLSGALLADLLAKSESSTSVSIQQQQQRGFFNPPAALSAEQQIDVASHQLAVFLASVCHYVIVVHDALASEDPEDALALSRFMRGVQQKLEQCRLPHISGVQVAGRKNVAKLLFVANNVASIDEVMENERLRRHVAALETMWGANLVVRARRSLLTPIVSGSSVQASPARDEAVETPTKGRRRSKPSTGGSSSSSSSPSGAVTPSPTKRDEGKSEREEDEGVPVFLLPHNRSQLLSQTDESPGKPRSKTKKADKRTRDSRAFEDAAQALRRFVRALPADATFASASSLPVSAAPSTTGMVPTEANARPLTLREWLSNASRVFDGVRKSGVFTAEYAAGR